MQCKYLIYTATMCKYILGICTQLVHSIPFILLALQVAGEKNK